MRGWLKTIFNKPEQPTDAKVKVVLEIEVTYDVSASAPGSFCIDVGDRSALAALQEDTKNALLDTLASHTGINESIARWITDDLYAVRSIKASAKG